MSLNCFFRTSREQPELRRTFSRIRMQHNRQPMRLRKSILLRRRVAVYVSLERRVPSEPDRDASARAGERRIARYDFFFVSKVVTETEAIRFRSYRGST